MSEPRGLPFIKLVGTGNDFIFLDFRTRQPLTDITRSQLAARIGHRNFGIGSDGVIFVDQSPTDPKKLKWDFYNPDGSFAEMCGNALRCMGKWAEQVMGVTQVTFETFRGDITVHKDGDNFVAAMNFVKFGSKPLSMSLEGFTIGAQLLNTGVPHAVVEVQSIDKSEGMKAIVDAFRFHPDAGERGTNVTFVVPKSARRIATVTYERGVEDYTLSCGTGVLAAAAYALKVSDPRSVPFDIEAEVETPGGKLKVLFKEKLSAVHLIGPAEVICTGLLEERYLR